MIKSVLIVNRGEIAIRIARTCREMGIRAIGVYSDADRNAAHLAAMDEAHYIGPSPASESYLNQERLLVVARQSKAEAVHPGYGFLAENAEFAQLVQDKQLIWIGPTPAAIASMGSKTGARALLQKAGVPVVPGSEGPLLSPQDAEVFAERVGYPIVIKAVAGGGGKGMRVVAAREQMWNSYESARREAEAAFGDGTVYAEKYLDKPRHIEVQVFADQQGNAIHLGERECSLQRRHQKIIEETPSMAVSPQLRQKMGETALAVVRACDYVNAGTVEMLLDQEGNYYFLEMNTRLQVEHAVTEEVTGLDLVRMQLMVAAGGNLPVKQEQIVWQGHSIETRICAEDVVNGFLPSTGKITHLTSPSGPGVREDSGMREGMEVSRFYDPLIAKLIVKGPDREAARARMIRALREYELAGVRSNISFCRHIFESPYFISGNFHTRSADGDLLKSFLLEQSRPLPDESILAAAIASALLRQTSDRTYMPNKKKAEGSGDGWRMAQRKRNVR